jgi:hypothetical protein
MSVGVMEEYKLRDLRASHTLGWSGKDVPFFFWQVCKQYRNCRESKKVSRSSEGREIESSSLRLLPHVPVIVDADAVVDRRYEIAALLVLWQYWVLSHH